MKFPGRKHTLHVNSCPDNSREKRTAKPHVCTSSWLQHSNKDMTRKKPFTSSPTARAVMHPWLLPTANGVNQLLKDCRTQSHVSENYASTGLGEFPTQHVLGLQDGFPRPPAEPVRADWWVAEGSQQWNMGPSAPLKQQLKLLAEFSCRRHAGEKGSGKGEWPPWFGIYSQFPLIIHCVTEAYSCPRKPAAPSSSSCISQTSVHHFTHKAHLWKPKETLSVQKAFTLGCAEAQLLHASADILGGCQGSVETALRPLNSRRQSTQRQLLTVAHSFQYYVRGQNCTEFNRILLPPDLCILLIRLINNSLYNIPACNTSPSPPQIEKSDAENLLFWA